MTLTGANPYCWQKTLSQCHFVNTTLTWTATKKNSTLLDELVSWNMLGSSHPRNYSHFLTHYVIYYYLIIWRDAGTYSAFETALLNKAVFFNIPVQFDRGAFLVQYFGFLIYKLAEICSHQTHIWYSVPFIVFPRNRNLSHIKPASAGTYYYSFRAHSNEELDTLLFHAPSLHHIQVSGLFIGSDGCLFPPEYYPS
jgi:hypothetical protein